MKTYLPLITLVAGFWFIACAASATKETSPAASNSIALNKPFHPRIAAKDTGIQQQIQKYAAEAKARVGVGAVDETVAVVVDAVGAVLGREVALRRALVSADAARAGIGGAVDVVVAVGDRRAALAARDRGDAAAA